MRRGAHGRGARGIPRGGPRGGRGGRDGSRFDRNHQSSRYPRFNERNIARNHEFHSSSPRSFKELNFQSSQSRFDLAPKGLEQFNAQQVKLLGILEPGKPPTNAQIELIKAKLDVPQLTPANSYLNRSLIIQGEYSAYISELFASVGIDTAFKEKGGLVVLPSPKHAALVLACPGPLDVQRPQGLLTSDDPDIWSNQRTRIGVVGESYPEPCEEIKTKDGQLKAVFFIGDAQPSSPLFPVQNPASSEPFDPSHLPNIEPRATNTLVVLNGDETAEFQELLNGLGAVKTTRSDDGLKTYVEFASVSQSAEAGHQLHDTKFHDRTILCGFWDGPPAYGL